MTESESTTGDELAKARTEAKVSGLEQQQQASNIESSATGKTEPMDLNAVDDDHALAQYAGHTGTLEQKVAKDALGEFLADMIYDSNSAFVREFLQNAETACIRAAKELLRQHPNYGEDWLTRDLWVDGSTGDTIAYGHDKQKILADYDVAADNLRQIQLPRAIEAVLEAARNIGYNPTITIDLDRDERQVVIEDNGIGMTTNELDNAYNTVLNSGVRADADTGGKYGIGSLTYANMTGLQGKMTGTTRTRQSLDTPDVEEYDHEGIRFAAYLGGVDPLPGEVDADFRGTRFEVPIQESVSLHEFQGWVSDYASYLRVPVLYQEHEGGQNTVKEEYGGESFLDHHGDAPIKIHRPGEFTVLAGPDIETGYRVPDTWLVSMTIDRNTYVTVESFWNVVVQIHDEQGRIVSGPHRGMHVDDLDALHEDDIPTPQPTGDRDRLQDDSNSKRFWNYVADTVEEYELSQVSGIAARMQEADHPADAIRGESEDWTLLKEMVNYHGGRNTTNSKSKFKEFLSENDSTFPDYDDETAEQVYGLFKTVSHAEENARNPNLKGGRTNRKLGDILANVPPENVYMGVSISKDLCTVVYNTHEKAAVIGVDGASKYSEYEDTFGFTKLKEVPRTQSDDHDFEVPDHIHERNQRKLNSDDGDTSKPDVMADRTLKLRGNPRNDSIDQRYTVEDFRERVENNNTVAHNRYVIAFPRGQDYENISDHYYMQKYASLVSVTQAEFGAINDLDNVFDFEAFKEFSRMTPIQTEDGEQELQDVFGEDSFPVLTYAQYDRENWLDVEDDEFGQRMRDLITEEAISAPYYGSGNKPEVEDTTFCVLEKADFTRAAYAINELYRKFTDHERRQSGVIVRYSYSDPHKFLRVEDSKVSSIDDKKLKARTPKWDDDSKVYKWLSRVDSRAYKPMKGMLMGFHDAGYDPTQFTEDTLRQMTGDYVTVGSPEWWEFAAAATEGDLGW